MPFGCCLKPRLSRESTCPRERDKKFFRRFIRYVAWRTYCRAAAAYNVLPSAGVECACPAQAPLISLRSPSVKGGGVSTPPPFLSRKKDHDHEQEDREDLYRHVDSSRSARAFRVDQHESRT